MSYFYALEKLAMAEYALAIGKGKLKDRLFEAYQELSSLQEHDLPEVFRSDFQWIKQTLTERPAKSFTVLRNGKSVQESTGRLGATLRYMRIEKAVEIAEQIYNLHARLRGYCYQEESTVT